MQNLPPNPHVNYQSNTHSNPVYIVPQQSSGWATASFVFGLLGIFGLDLIGAFLFAIIFGHIALSQIKRSNGRIGGKGFAVAGLILGYVPLVIGIVVLSFVLMTGLSLLSAGREAQRAQERQQANNQRERQERLERAPLAVLQGYTGNYAFKNGKTGKEDWLRAEMDGDWLSIKIGAMRCWLDPVNETEFAVQNCRNGQSGKARFVTGASGKAEQLILTLDEMTATMSRVEN